MFSFLLLYCFTYLLNKDVYLSLIENFPLGSGTRPKVILINVLLIWIIHLSGFDLRWCLVLLCKEVCTEYFCVRCLDCPFKGWRSAAIWGVGIQLSGAGLCGSLAGLLFSFLLNVCFPFLSFKFWFFPWRGKRRYNANLFHFLVSLWCVYQTVSWILLRENNKVCNKKLTTDRFLNSGNMSKFIVGGQILFLSPPLLNMAFRI